MLIICLIIICIVIIVLFNYLRLTKCPYCKSRKVTVIQKTELYSEPVLFKENVKIKEYENKGNFRSDTMLNTMSNKYVNPPKKIITQETFVQGKRTWYDVHYKCNECNKAFSQKEYNDIKPTTVK